MSDPQPPGGHHRRDTPPRHTPPPRPRRGYPPQQPPPQQPPPRRPAGGGPTRPRDRTPPDESPTELLWLDNGLLPGADDYETYDDYYEGDLDLVDEEDGEHDPDADERAEPDYYDDERPEPRRSRSGRTRKRALGWVAAIAAIVLLAGAAYVGGRELLGIGYDDYTGAGEAETVVKVSEGDTTRQIAVTLAEADVVASAEAFIVAGKESSQVRAIQPGYYVMKTKASGQNAVQRIVADSARAGHFEVRPGLQLEDITMPDGSTTAGILRRLSEASCTKLNGESTCISVDKLSKTIAGADPAALGVPEWAVDNAAKAQGLRKLEGLIAPGHYNVRPGSGAEELLRKVLETSASRMQAAGLPDAAADTGYGPYEVLTIASLIQREGITEDFGKISRVIYNRLAQDMLLGLDSTINYVQDTPTVRTTDEERAKEGPYNTYRNPGLPPTPISSPSDDAIKMALNPPAGDWLYFVRCQASGKSCFSTNYADHQRKATDARQRGVY